MLIQRHVIEKMIEAHPEWAYKNSDGAMLHALFDFGIVNEQYVGEDYTFCDRATQLGFKVYIDVDISLPHVGTEAFTSNFREDVVMPLLEDIRQSRLKVVNG
jgi:hypothetical protein